MSGTGVALDPEVVLATGWAEPLFEALGAQEIASMDMSASEGAELVHNLNEPLPDELRGRFTALVDGGTMEHVFNVPVALESVARLLEPGGHALLWNPGNNYFGHGFYQFSPEFYWRVLPAHGLDVACVLYKEDVGGSWYEVADPWMLGRPVLLGRGRPALLYTLARKTSDRREPVVQADYALDWYAGWPRARPLARRGVAGFVRRRLPRGLVSALRRVRNRPQKRDPEAFRRVEL